MTTGKMMFYFGTGLLAIALILGIIGFFILKRMNENVNRQLEKEYH